MACERIKVSAEEVANARKNNSIYVQPSLNQTQEETLMKLDELMSVTRLVDNKYQVAGVKIKSRVSEVYKRAKHLMEQSIDPDNDIKRNGGTFIHSIMRDLIEFRFNGKGDISSIRNKAKRGDVNSNFSIDKSQVDNLDLLAQELTKEIHTVQESINKNTGTNGKAEIRTEAFIADFLKDIGGTEDIIVVYSDNTFDTIDFKTSGKNDPISYENNKAVVRKNIFPLNAVDAYRMSQGEYARIMKQRIGGKDVRRNRLVPIAVAYRLKNIKEREKGQYLKPEFAEIVAYQEDEFLRQIPVTGEKTPYKGINKFLEKQFKIIGDLTKQLRTKNLTPDQRDIIQSRINRLDESIKKVFLDNDIATILYELVKLTTEVGSKLDKQKSDPGYMEDIDMKNYIEHMRLYDDIFNDTNSYYQDIKKADKEKYDKLRTTLFKVRPSFEGVYIRLREEYQRRAENLLYEGYRDADGHMIPVAELNFGQLNFLKLSEIDHPIYKAFWKIIEEAQFKMKRAFNEMDKDVYSKTNNLFKWARDQFGIVNPRQKAFDMLIDKTTGNLFPRLRKGFIRDLSNAIKDGGIKGIKAAKDNYEFINKEEWKKEYDERLEGFKIHTRYSYNDFEPTEDIDSKIIETKEEKELKYEKEIVDFIKKNNLFDSDYAWLNRDNRRKYLRLKKEVIENNYSNEYNIIRGIRPLHDYYEMWNSYMEKFADMLNITSYSNLPPNFIPNIRKEMSEHLDSDGLHWAAIGEEFMDQFSVREEDTYLSSFSEDGIERSIPILFMNKFRNKDGTIDNNRKSYDLSRSLMLFGKMAYNYKHMSEIEPKVNMLRSLLGEPTAEQGGTEATDRLGRKIIGKVQPYLTVEGRLTETFKLFEDITDYYLYGIKFKQKTLMPGVDMVHKLSMAKNYNSMVKLGFAVIPAMGALLAGKLGTIINSYKSIMFTPEGLAIATIMSVKDSKKFKAIARFWDAENDNYVERELQKHRLSKKNRLLSSRTMFAPLRGADTLITNSNAVAMMYNWGVTKDGNVVRFTKTGKEKGLYKDIKTLIDSVEIDKDGKASIKGLSDSGYMQFRAAIKSATSEVIGNMNPDDIGAIDTNFFINQAMAFKSWMPGVVLEYTGKLRWNETTQAMRWGRFRAYLSEYRKDLHFTEDELEHGKIFYSYISSVVLPNISRLILDLGTFGIAPTLLKKVGVKGVSVSDINIDKAKLAFAKWQRENPGLQDIVTFDHYLEIKEGQIKAMLVQLRFIVSIMMIAAFLGAAGDDGEPRYYENWVTRNMYKMMSKAGSELTFMWNPTEFLRLVKNPWPLTGLLVQVKNTVFNGFDETKELITGEKDTRDRTPAGYYMMQWMYGAPQLSRFFEVYANMKKNPYDVFSSNTF